MPNWVRTILRCPTHRQEATYCVRVDQGVPQPLRCQPSGGRGMPMCSCAVSVSGDLQRLVADAVRRGWGEWIRKGAVAIVNVAGDRARIPAASGFRSMAGLGVQAVVDGETVALGGPLCSPRPVPSCRTPCGRRRPGGQAGVRPCSTCCEPERWQVRSPWRTRSDRSPGRRSTSFTDAACAS